AGALRVVVATMGLAAGINFSLRSVALAAASYRRDMVEIQIRADEILQMMGRAGRRGIDDTGYFLVSANDLRLRNGHAAHLARCGIVDWNALLGLMHAANAAGRDPFAEAVRVQQRLFSSKPVILGVEESLKNPDPPCGLKTDAERARHVAKMVRQILNSRGEWEPWAMPREVPAAEVKAMTPLSEGELALLKLEIKSRGAASADGPFPRSAELQLRENTPTRGAGAPRSDEADAPATPHSALRTPHLLPALAVPEALEKLGHGTLVKLPDGTHARSVAVADILNGQHVLLAKWVRKLTNWNARETSLEAWRESVVPILERELAAQKTPVVGYEYPQPSGGDPAVGTVRVQLSLARLPLKAAVDSHGVALWQPVTREVVPADCARCPLTSVCRTLSTATGVATLWRRLGLVDAAGVPTRRGRVMSFFQQGDGLGIAAALEDEKFPINEFIYELANLHAGHRFASEDTRWSGRTAIACQRTYGAQTIPGYLENGLPPEYGAGGEEIAQSVHRDPFSKHAWATDFIGAGDIDRLIIEWRSMLRQVSHSPPLEWPRWTALQKMAKAILEQTESPTMLDLPALSQSQTKRVEHRLSFRRH
ncbi:MAG: DEAD/DEAH box helicase, partial [Verrucomicrobia bacterium]|nr:DEAD/DEAH box helicase [Verrucomicrobiota bacterium]